MRAGHHPNSSVPVTRSLTWERGVLPSPYPTSEQADAQRGEAMRLRSHGYEAELEFESCGFTVCMLLQLMLRGGSVSGSSIVFALTVPISSIPTEILGSFFPVTQTSWGPPHTSLCIACACGYQKAVEGISCRDHDLPRADAPH